MIDTRTPEAQELLKGFEFTPRVVKCPRCKKKHHSHCRGSEVVSIACACGYSFSPKRLAQKRFIKNALKSRK